jgi:hypothetical protein
VQEFSDTRAKDQQISRRLTQISADRKTNA